MRVEPRSSARRGALQVPVGARFRSLQGKLQGHVEARSGERIGLGTLQVRVEPRSSARRGALQVSVGARFR